MKSIGVNEIRETFLSFFESKDHLRLKSFSLIPQNDKSLLIINSGMAPLKPYFTGQETPPKNRVTTCQKCIRLVDIDNVGKTARHGTFFEMLGNFSFGDYFKEEIIPWAWEYLTEVLEIPAEKLYVSVYLDDDEAYDIWRGKVGLPPEKIVRLGKEDNFWEHGLGPCGPCSEIHYDTGLEGCTNPNCSVGCGCDRFMEVWNLVFTQFNKQEDGSYIRLEKPSIDTGMGLERLAKVLQGVESLLDVDTLKAIRDKICVLAKTEYHADADKDISIRVIQDHIRSVTFMTADGILPSNEGRGYVLRRLLRRASMHGRLLGIKGTFLAELSNAVIDVSCQAYPELFEKRDYIFKVLSVEENRFHETLEQGMEILKTHIERLKREHQHDMEGLDAFRMYDTFGFPLELLKEILGSESLGLNEETFKAAMEEQKNRARAARSETNYMGADETVYNRLPQGRETVFTGYDELETNGCVIEHIISGDNTVNEANVGDTVNIILDKSPIYAASGGQSADKGFVFTQNGEAEITDCAKVIGGRFSLKGTVTMGALHVGDTARITVDKERRMGTARNHTATHLLHKALKEVLGGHVEQAGSLVTHERLRFDFTHFAPLTPEELERVENIVNDKILEGLNVSVIETDVETARKNGATALFGEKYGERVRMVSISDYSVELCGGTHLTNTALAGVFRIVSETGVAAGVRRVEALTGKAALSWFKSQDSMLKLVGRLLKTPPENMIKRIETFLDESHTLTAELARLKSKMSLNAVDDILKSAEKINGVNVIAARVDGLDMNSLREMGDKLRDKTPSGVIVLASGKEDKVSLLAIATDDLVKSGVHAGNIIKGAAAACGGGGGGKPNMAQAGGKDISKIDEALKKAVEAIKAQTVK